MFLSFTDADDQDNLVGKIEKHYGKLDVLINNAGVMLKYDFAEEQGTLVKIRQDIEINTIAPLSLTYKFLPLLKKVKHLLWFLSVLASLICHFRIHLFILLQKR